MVNASFFQIQSPMGLSLSSLGTASPKLTLAKQLLGSANSVGLALLCGGRCVLFICKSIQNSIQFFCKCPFRSSLFTSASLSCSHSHGSAHMFGVKWHCRYVMPSITSASLIERSLLQDSTPFAYLFNSPILLT